MGEGKFQDWPRAGFGLARLGSRQTTFGIPGIPKKSKKVEKSRKNPIFRKCKIVYHRPESHRYEKKKIGPTLVFDKGGFSGFFGILAKTGPWPGLSRGIRHHRIGYQVCKLNWN